MRARFIPTLAVMHVKQIVELDEPDAQCASTQPANGPAWTTNVQFAWIPDRHDARWGSIAAD